MKSSNKYLLILVAILVISLGIGMYFKFSPRAFEGMTDKPTPTAVTETPTAVPSVVSELPKPTALPTRTPLPLLDIKPTSPTIPADILANLDILSQSKGNLNFAEL